MLHLYNTSNFPTRNLLKDKRKEFQEKCFCQKHYPSLVGFTLMELLVVISIMGLLAGILLPTLSMARQRALRAECISNLRQIGIALLLYAGDYNGSYPIAGGYIKWGEKDPTTGNYGWMEQLYPYSNNKELYSCPANQAFPEYSYFLGARAAFVDRKPPDYASVSIKKIKYPTAFVLGGDTTKDSGDDGTHGGFNIDDCDKDDYSHNCVGGKEGDPGWWTGWKVHMEGQDILFADGHVDWFQGYVKGKMTFRYDEMCKWEGCE